MAPIHLFPLFEIYTSPAIQSCPHLSRPTGSCRPLEELQDWGLIEPEPFEVEKHCHGLKVTAKGMALIEAILDMPMPVQVWQVPSKDNGR